jgi:hypothetical protein
VYIFYFFRIGHINADSKKKNLYRIETIKGMVQVKKKSDAKMWWARDLMKRCGEVGIVSSDEREKHGDVAFCVQVARCPDISVSDSTGTRTRDTSRVRVNPRQHCLESVCMQSVVAYLSSLEQGMLKVVMVLSYSKCP